MNKKFENIFEKRNNLEHTVFKKLEEKVMCNKTTKYINELLINTKDAVLQNEISVAHIENTYGNNLLQLEKLKNLIENKKIELQELLEKNVGKEKQIDELQRKIKKYETMTKKAQTKLLGINKLIDQVIHSILLIK